MGAFKRKYKDTAGKTVTAKDWSCEFYIDGQRFCTTVKGTSALSQKQADKLCDDLKEQKKQELYGTKAVTFDDAMLAFHEDYALKIDKRRKEAPHKRIKDAYLPIIEKNLQPYFTGKPLDRITRADVVDYILQRRRAGLKDKTIRNDINCLSSMYSHAERLGLCDDRDIPNFASIRKMLKPSKPKTRYLSPEDFDKLVEKCAGARLVNLRFYVQFDVETGLRMEELFSLRWPDVDISARRMRITDTKNGKDRNVPLSERAIQLLREQLQRQQQKKIKTEYVMARNSGARYTWIEGPFKNACKDAGITYSIHDLRKTFGSWRLQGIRGKKLDLKEVSLVLGHSSVQQTESTYAFLKEEEITL